MDFLSIRFYFTFASCERIDFPHIKTFIGIKKQQSRKSQQHKFKGHLAEIRVEKIMERKRNAKNRSHGSNYKFIIPIRFILPDKYKIVQRSEGLLQNGVSG
jgi:hypothetical protein